MQTFRPRRSIVPSVPWTRPPRRQRLGAVRMATQEPVRTGSIDLDEPMTDLDIETLELLLALLAQSYERWQELEDLQA